MALSCSQITYPCRDYPLSTDQFLNLLHVRKFLVSLPLQVSHVATLMQARAFLTQACLLE